jgi:hypothetical protein
MSSSISHVREASEVEECEIVSSPATFACKSTVVAALAEVKARLSASIEARLLECQRKLDSNESLPSIKHLAKTVNKHGLPLCGLISFFKTGDRRVLAEWRSQYDLHITACGDTIREAYVSLLQESQQHRQCARCKTAIPVLPDVSASEARCPSCDYREWVVESSEPQYLADCTICTERHLKVSAKHLSCCKKDVCERCYDKLRFKACPYCRSEERHYSDSDNESETYY